MYFLKVWSSTCVEGGGIFRRLLQKQKRWWVPFLYSPNLESQTPVETSGNAVKHNLLTQHTLPLHSSADTSLPIYPTWQGSLQSGSYHISSCKQPQQTLQIRFCPGKWGRYHTSILAVLVAKPYNWQAESAERVPSWSVHLQPLPNEWGRHLVWLLALFTKESLSEDNAGRALTNSVQANLQEMNWGQACGMITDTAQLQWPTMAPNWPLNRTRTKPNPQQTKWAIAVNWTEGKWGSATIVEYR